jgi:hypothetical protein
MNHIEIVTKYKDFEKYFDLKLGSKEYLVLTKERNRLNEQIRIIKNSCESKINPKDIDFNDFKLTVYKTVEGNYNRGFTCDLCVGSYFNKKEKTYIPLSYFVIDNISILNYQKFYSRGFVDYLYHIKGYSFFSAKNSKKDVILKSDKSPLFFNRKNIEDVDVDQTYNTTLDIYKSIHLNDFKTFKKFHVEKRRVFYAFVNENVRKTKLKEIGIDVHIYHQMYFEIVRFYADKFNFPIYTSSNTMKSESAQKSWKKIEKNLPEDLELFENHISDNKNIIGIKRKK